MTKMRIAIADDEMAARDYVAEILTTAGYDCVTCSNGRDLIARLKRETFDLLVLDWNMPGMTAIDVIEWVRTSQEHDPRVIVLTSRSEEKDMTFALDAGADDFITKPGSPDVIRARVAAALRRREIGQQSARFDRRGRYVFDKLEQSVALDGQAIKVTSKEFALAILFFDNLHRPLSRGYILQRIWSNTADLSTRTLDMHVSKIRTKLGWRPDNGYRLQTIVGYGYRLDAFDEDSADQG